MTKPRVAAVEGLYTLDEDNPHLLGTRCQSCGTYYFPAERSFCRNPACSTDAFDDVELSNEGTVWSFTNAKYKPPPPFIAKEPFEPFAIAAVELAEEGITVLGQVADGVGVEALAAGTRMKMTLSELYEDEDNVYLSWQWRVQP